VANSLEGGVVLTRDGLLADRLRKMRNFGFAGYDQVVSLGTNAKMHEFSAAMGLGSLENLDSFVAVNEGNLAAYQEELVGVPGLQLISYDAGERNNFQYVVAEVDSAQCPLNRDELLAVLHAENVMARRYFYPGCHRSEPYRTRYPWWHDSLPETNRLAQRVLAFPTGTGVDAGEIKQIVRMVRFALRHAEQVRRHLQAHTSSRAA
jgi:dTDP-4-amino-4,6-dideoxygalactose transaminase